MEEMKTSIGQFKVPKIWTKKREALEREFALLSKEAQKFQEESIILRTLKDEKETLVGFLQSEMKRLVSEAESLKERNMHMENELKEMQEKYSEISLKFAEVEGERQQLVMTLRNLKN
ncbi:unnamed protein product, partial [Ilex paraguariensis]